MTRFARAKGSKASNERLPDEPTPWHVMKQQLDESVSTKECEKKCKSAKELLKEKETPYYSTSIGDIKTDWADFDKNPEKSSKKPKLNVPSPQKIVDEVQAVDLPTKAGKKLKKRKIENPPTNPTEKKKLKKEKSTENLPEVENVPEGAEKLDSSRKLSKRQKRNRKNKKPEGSENENQAGNIQEKKKKVGKIRDGKEHKRRKPLPSSKVIINGLEVEITMYDGFPVKKEDAERLANLRREMVMKGIPSKDINAAMKLERRKAEKALARVRKSVCFHCRKAGHNLSDCPELGKEECMTGICFKCGSTEHTHFECKVNKKEEFRFTSCFICRQQGHIAKQCPDNPRGLYPDGGSCKICGDVTHLKKDCPDLVKEKEEATVTLQTIGENSLEALDGEKTKKIEETQPKIKIVKF